METIIDNSKQPQKLTYLTAQLPKKFGIARIVANRLNARGSEPSVAREYSENIVNNVINGRTDNPVVKKEVEKVVNEYLKEIA